MEFCKRCLLPETYPKLYINAEGLCNVCVEYEKKFKKFNPHDAELALKKKVCEEKENRNKFVVTCSGGIDSSYVLYLCKTKYHLDIVGANFDNGFQSDTARENLLNLSTILDILIITIKPHLDVLHRLYRDFLLRTGDFCTPCCQGCCRSGFMVASNNNVKTIIHGGVSGSRVEFNVLGMFKHHYKRFMKIIGDDYSDEELCDIVTPTEEVKKFNLVSMPQYENWEERKIIRILESEVNWKTMPDGTARHLDCLVAKAEDYLMQRKFGFSRVWMHISANLRAGFLDAEEGRAMIKNQETELKEEPKESMNVLLDKICLTRNQIHELPFFKNEPVVNFL